MYNLLHVLIYFSSWLVYVECNEGPIVDTTHGKIRGKVFRTLIKEVEYVGFIGIPYAAPPVKELRFMPPQPIDPWDDVLAATKEKTACVQFNNNIKKGQPLGHYGVEDCLYLDIFTPALDENKRAVMMFIYNENFMGSYNKTKDYEPDFLIEEDVVVVTISHRLSAFGFLSLEDETMPGNAGLRDIITGLKWMRNNIERFGGDPERITLMGVLGGAAAVDLLMHTDAKGLFSGAILQSGSSWSTAFLQENARERAFNLGELMKIGSTSGTTLVNELNNIPAGELLSKDLHASPKDYFKETQRCIVAFGPIVEKQPGGLIKEYPENSSEKINIPVMLGFNSREGLDASLQYLIEPRFITFLRKDFPFLLPMRLNFRFDPFNDAYYDAAAEIRSHYFNDKINLKSVPDFVTYMGDAVTAYAVNHAARTYANRSSSAVYYYHFNYYSGLSENKNNLMKLSVVEEGTWGAASGDELCYLLKCPSLEKQYLKHHNAMSEERRVQIKMVKMWTNFAKYRDPTPASDISLEGLEWPPYTLENKDYLHIDKQIGIKRDLYRNKFQFWDDFIGKWERKAVNGIVTEPLYKKDEL